MAKDPVCGMDVDENRRRVGPSTMDKPIISARFIAKRSLRRSQQNTLGGDQLLRGRA